jgi:predicted RNase H-like HicB family nuclease
MAMGVAYRVILEPDEDMLRCIIPAFPTIFTYGRDRAHALEMAKEAVDLELEVLAERGFPATDRDGHILVLVERVAVKAAPEPS